MVKRHLGEQSGIKTMEDWYRLDFTDLRNATGARNLLERHYDSSIPKFVSSVCYYYYYYFDYFIPSVTSYVVYFDLFVNGIVLEGVS